MADIYTTLVLLGPNALPSRQMRTVHLRAETSCDMTQSSSAGFTRWAQHAGSRTC